MSLFTEEKTLCQTKISATLILKRKKRSKEKDLVKKAEKKIPIFIPSYILSIPFINIMICSNQKHIFQNWNFDFFQMGFIYLLLEIIYLCFFFYVSGLMGFEWGTCENIKTRELIWFDTPIFQIIIWSTFDEQKVLKKYINNYQFLLFFMKNIK